MKVPLRSDFKVGDRVAIHGSLYGEQFSTTVVVEGARATVSLSPDNSTLYLCVVLDEVIDPRSNWYVKFFDCRKLRKVSK